MASTAKTTKSSKRKPALRTARTVASKKSGFQPPSRRTLLVVFAVVFGLIGITMTVLSFATVFQYAGTHPQSANQPENSTGRQLASLEAWNGKIYAGYGDWNKNTGPMSVTPFDPVTGKFADVPEFVADTESVETWKVIGGKLYALHIDPKSHNGATFSVADATSGKPVWKNDMYAKVTHAYGMTRGNSDSEIFISGQLDEGASTNEVAKVYRSTDGGVTWSESLSVPSRGGYNRMLFIAKFGDKIFAQRLSTSDFSGANPQIQAWIFNGSSWSKASPLPNMYNATKGGEFAGKMLALASPFGGNMVSYDGRSTTTVKPGVADYKVHSDGYLYALHYSGDGMSVSRTKDLASWEVITAAPSNSRSLAILDTTLYIGTRDSQLYRATIDPTVKDSKPPTVQLLGPASGYVVVAGINELAAQATDEASIKRVDFYVGDILVGSAFGKALGSGCSPTATTCDLAHYTRYPGSYVLKWNGSGLPAGTYLLRAVAYDIYGNSSQSSTVSVTIPVGLYPPDTEKPTISVTSPSLDQRVRKTLWVAASANDNDALAGLEVELDGNLVITTDNSNIASISQSIPVSRGSHVLVITAKDRAGNVTQVERAFNSR